MISASDILNAKILVVDDRQSNVLLLEKMLGSDGYTQITSTTNPREVRALHKRNLYDLIILDLQMPGMDGFAVMEELQKEASAGYLPILVITAQPSERIRALTSGARDFLSKPFDVLEAKTRIHNMLEVSLLYKQLERSNHALTSLALHDPLTGLPNRRLLMDRLELSVAHAHRNHHAMAVLYLDLDDFKVINDTLGHDAGDALLSVVAARLTAAVRQEDTVARLGGDEFIIALGAMGDADAVATLAAKIAHTVSQPFNVQGRTISMTTSIGVSIFPTHGVNAEALMKSADVALYEAKRTGKNSYCIAVSTTPELVN
jgi:diguanylate cyclase (GGDEF)-like protein